MYKISLLPVKYKQAITAERKKNDIIISFIFTIIILIILSIMAFAVNALVKNDLAVIQSENNALLNEIGVLSKYRDMQNQIAVITGEIQTLADEAPSFPRILSEITQSVPDSLQITSIKFTYKKDTKISLLEVTGNSAYYDDVSVWINKLNGVEKIGEVLCSYTNNATDDSVTRVRFELSMDILDKSAVEDIVWQWRSE